MRNLQVKPWFGVTYPITCVFYSAITCGSQGTTPDETNVNSDKNDNVRMARTSRAKCAPPQTFTAMDGGLPASQESRVHFLDKTRTT